MRLRRDFRGFTMIEMIMLVAIGAFVVGGIVAFTRNVAENTIATKDRLAALDLAQRQMETELNAYYGTVYAADGSCGAAPENHPFNLRVDVDGVDDTDTTHGGFLVRRTVTETVTKTPAMEDFSQPIGTDPLDPVCIGLKKIDILVDYAGGTFANPLVKLTAYSENSILLDTE